MLRPGFGRRGRERLRQKASQNRVYLNVRVELVGTAKQEVRNLFVSLLVVAAGSTNCNLVESPAKTESRAGPQLQHTRSSSAIRLHTRERERERESARERERERLRHECNSIRTPFYFNENSIAACPLV